MCPDLCSYGPVSMCTWNALEENRALKRAVKTINKTYCTIRESSGSGRYSPIAAHIMCRSVFLAGRTPLQWTVEIISQIPPVQSVIIVSQQSFATRIFIQIYFIQTVIPALILRRMTVFAPNPVSSVLPSQIESSADCGKFSLWEIQFSLWEIQIVGNSVSAKFA
jgi:hypothetical protein